MSHFEIDFDFVGNPRKSVGREKALAESPVLAGGAGSEPYNYSIQVEAYFRSGVPESERFRET